MPAANATASGPGRSTITARPGGASSNKLASATPREAKLCNMLQMVWFAAMLGWMSAQYKQEEVVEQVRAAAELALGQGFVQTSE